MHLLLVPQVGMFVMKSAFRLSDYKCVQDVVFCDPSEGLPLEVVPRRRVGSAQPSSQLTFLQDPFPRHAVPIPHPQGC